MFLVFHSTCHAGYLFVYYRACAPPLPTTSCPRSAALPPCDLSPLVFLQYTHSAWHLALALSLLALLPGGGRRGRRSSDRLPLVPDGDSGPHELDELGSGRGSPTFCRPDPAAAAPVRGVVTATAAGS